MSLNGYILVQGIKVSRILALPKLQGLNKITFHETRARSMRGKLPKRSDLGAGQLRGWMPSVCSRTSPYDSSA